MEEITPRSEYYLLESHISAQNAQILRAIHEVTAVSFTEQIRRAAALYDLALDIFNQGGNMHYALDEGAEMIPLFNQPNDEGYDESRVFLRVNINTETANLFKKLGVNSNDNETYVLDNVIHHYQLVTNKYLAGHKIIAESPEGLKREIELLI